MRLTSDEFERRHDRLEQTLKPGLTDEFLAFLVKVARVYGWSGDYVEVRDFVRECFYLADKEPPAPERLESYMSKYLG